MLSRLKDPHIASVIGVITKEEPLAVNMETLDYGDLCQLLRDCDKAPQMVQSLDLKPLE